MFRSGRGAAGNRSRSGACRGALPPLRLQATPGGVSGSVRRCECFEPPVNASNLPTTALPSANKVYFHRTQPGSLFGGFSGGVPVLGATRFAGEALPTRMSSVGHVGLQAPRRFFSPRRHHPLARSAASARRLAVVPAAWPPGHPRGLRRGDEIRARALRSYRSTR